MLQRIYAPLGPLLFQVPVYPPTRMQDHKNYVTRRVMHGELALDIMVCLQAHLWGAWRQWLTNFSSNYHHTSQIQNL